VFAFNVNTEAHKFCDRPAFAMVGRSSTKMVTVETEDKQGELEIAHSKTFVPKPNPVMVVFGKVGFVIIPLPEINVHKPVPTIGVFAAIVVVGEEIHSV
jgi:hypothetical protein